MTSQHEETPAATLTLSRSLSRPSVLTASLHLRTTGRCHYYCLLPGRPPQATISSLRPASCSDIVREHPTSPILHQTELPGGSLLLEACPPSSSGRSSAGLHLRTSSFSTHYGSCLSLAYLHSTITYYRAHPVSSLHRSSVATSQSRLAGTCRRPFVINTISNSFELAKTFAHFTPLHRWEPPEQALCARVTADKRSRSSIASPKEEV